jgi:hypothetical protein
MVLLGEDGATARDVGGQRQKKSGCSRRRSTDNKGEIVDEDGDDGNDSAEDDVETNDEMRGMLMSCLLPMMATKSWSWSQKNARLNMIYV